MSEIEGLKLLRRIEEGVAGKTGEAFFRQIVCDLARALNAHSAFTSRLMPERRASMLAFWVGEQYEKCLDYSLAGTPCEYVYAGRITAYARDVGKVFPVDREWFEQLGVVSYLGIPVNGESGEVCGHLAVMDTRERDWRDADVDVLRLFSLRSAAEIERSRYQRELEEANSTLRSLNQQLQQEIAKREQIEMQLGEAKNSAESASRAKSAFISQMSHELRTPLNGILGYAQLLGQRRESLPSGHAEGLAVIERSGQHLLTLINDLLDLAKIEAGKLEVKRERVDLRELMQHVTELIRPRAAQAGQTFCFDADPRSLTCVVSDARALRQILLNLLGNAVKFTAAGGRVALLVELVSASDGTATYRFNVEDSGIGIDASEIPRLFEPFHRIVRPECPVEGTGLGLAITKRLVDALGGRIQVSSRAGAGSRFVVELGLELAENRAGQSALALDIEGYEGERRRVLVADDQHDNRTIVAKLLDSVGFEVQCVSNGAQALEQIEGAAPDLLITDVVMPAMDGLALVKALRSAPRTRDIPVIALSSSAGEYTRNEALAVGCNAFIAKPFRLTALLDEIARVLKLEWRVRERPAQAVRPTMEADSASFQLDDNLADELQHLAMLGDIRALMARAEEALGNNPAALVFRSEFRVLAERYDTRGIRRVIGSHRAASADRA